MATHFQMWQVKAGNLCEFVEREIEQGRNPKTQEEWHRLLEKMYDQGLADMIGNKMVSN